MIAVSLVVITKNEQSHIERCLKSVPFVNDIVVLDSGSEDATCAIARKLGARVFEESWRGYGPQKQRGVELARHDWILSLDADESLSPQLRQEMQKTLEAEPQCDGFSCPRLSYHLGRWIRHGGWYPDRQLRLFNRRTAAWESIGIHERVRAVKVRKLTHPIIHFVFSNLSHQVLTNDRYSTLLAQQLRNKNVRFSVLKLLVKPISKFLETYLWKRGFLDGLAGFIISVGAAHSVFLKFAKLWELQQQNSSLSSVSPCDSKK